MASDDDDDDDDNDDDDDYNDEDDDDDEDDGDDDDDDDDDVECKTYGGWVAILVGGATTAVKASVRPLFLPFTR